MSDTDICDKSLRPNLRFNLRPNFPPQAGSIAAIRTKCTCSGFCTLLLQLLSYGTTVHLMTQDTALTSQPPAAKSHPIESNTLHLLPVEHLRNLVATHTELLWELSGVITSGTRSCRSSLSAEPVVAERYLHAFSLPAVGFLHKLL